MTDQSPPTARLGRLRQLSLVWLIPLLAISVGLWMVYDTWRNQGPEITLTMPSAEGIEAGKTPIKVRDVAIGRVTSVSLSDKGDTVIATAQLDKSAAPLLFSDSQFWVVRPRVDSGGVSGLSTLLSGAYIQFQPGKSGQKQHSFKILAAPPVTAPDVPGLRLTLDARDVPTVGVGSPVLFQHYEVGRVEKAQFDTEARQMRYQIFIHRPYDRLVTSNSRFWVSSGVNLALTAAGLQLNVGSVQTLLSGGIAFDVPPGHSLGDAVGNQSRFMLYASEENARNLYYEQQLPYVVLFNESVRGLTVGAPVEYRGIRVGSVAAVPLTSLDIGPKKTGGNVGIPVLINLEVGRFDPDASKRPAGYWQARVAESIKGGMVARLKTGNLLSGALFVDLDFSGKKVRALPKPFLTYPVLPASDSGGLSQIENKVIALLDKLNALKLEDTLNNADAALASTRDAAERTRVLMGEIDKLVANPQTQALPGDARKTLEQLRESAASFSADSAAYQELTQTLTTLNQLLQNARPLVRTLDAQPNALLFDRNDTDPTPKGARP